MIILKTFYSANSFPHTVLGPYRERLFFAKIANVPYRALVPYKERLFQKNSKISSCSTKRMITVFQKLHFHALALFYFWDIYNLLSLF